MKCFCLLFSYNSIYQYSLVVSSSRRSVHFEEWNKLPGLHVPDLLKATIIDCLVSIRTLR